MTKISYPFAAVPNQIIRGGHGITNIAVLAALLSHGKTTCSMATLARELGCNKKTILPAIRYWIENGKEVGVEVLATDKLGCPTVYEVNIHIMYEPAPKTGQVARTTSPEIGSGVGPKTGHPPDPKTGHKEEPIKKNPKEESPLPPKKYFFGDIDPSEREPEPVEPDSSRLYSSPESMREILNRRGALSAGRK